MLEISACLPIHNEAKYLRYSLASMRKLDVDEWIVVLDRCTDESEKLIKKYLPKAKIYHKTTRKWRNPVAESFQYAYDRATGEVLLALGADLIVDPQITEIIRKLFRNPDVGTVCFRYLNYDLFSLRLRIHGFYENLYKSIVQHFRKEARHTGFYAFRRQMMEEIGGLRDVPSEYDDFCRRVKNSRWKYVYVPFTKTLHLRVGLTKTKQFTQGKSRFYLPQYDLKKTLFHAFIHMKPYLLLGYLHESYMHKNTMRGQSFTIRKSFLKNY